jgi:hypothetical protein
MLSLMLYLLTSASCGPWCSFGSENPEPARAQARPEWGTGVYNGIVIGKTNRAELLKRFGTPKWQGAPLDQDPNDANPVIWYEYLRADACIGRARLTIEVRKRTGRVIALWIVMPEGARSDVASVSRCLGGEFLEARYSFCERIEAESGQIYADDHGEISFLENRARGIAISIDLDNTIKEIQFVNGPIGVSSQAHCRRRQ